MLIHVLGSQDSDQAFVQTSLLFGRGMIVLRFIVSKNYDTVKNHAVKNL